MLVDGLKQNLLYWKYAGESVHVKKTVTFHAQIAGLLQHLSCKFLPRFSIFLALMPPLIPHKRTDKGPSSYWKFSLNPL